MQAPRIETQTLPPPPGIMGALRTGFDTIAGNVSVILMPLAVDLLLWLGPRLSPARLLNTVFESNMNTLTRTYGLKLDALQSNWIASAPLLQSFNLLGFLRTFPIGISSLMSGNMPPKTPWGAPRIFDIASVSQGLAVLVLVILAGWVLGAIYFRWVGVLATPGLAADNHPGAGRAIVQTTIYAAMWLVVAWVVGVPLLTLLVVLSAVNGTLAQGVLLLLGFLSMWLVVPVFFSPHGIFVRRQTALASIQSGFELTRFTLPTSSLFVLVVFMLGTGLNFLWSLPEAQSWLVLAGIFGHAFITTSLLAASFVYYHNMTVWLQAALARLRAGLPGQQA